jgi:hypothetical protein
VGRAKAVGIPKTHGRGSLAGFEADPALTVLCCDPLAIALTAAASARRQPLSKPHLVRSTFYSGRADAIEGHRG